jgi:rhomboid protease GluP
MRLKNELLFFYKKHPVLSILFLLNIIVFVMTHVSLFPNRYIYSQMAGVNILIAEGELWRLVTPIFVHSNFNHLFYNSLGLILSGIILSEYIKRNTFLLIYLSSGIFANVITYIFAPPIYVHVGASGAIFGLLGVIAALIYFKKIPRLQSQMFTFFIIFALIFTFLNPSINIFSHIGGLVWGILCGFYITKKT